MRRIALLLLGVTLCLTSYALVPTTLTKPLEMAGIHFDDKHTHWQTLQEQYAINYPMWDSVLIWISRHDVEHMPAGKYYVCDSLVMIRIMDGNTRAESKIEAHRRFVDLQWTVCGKEIYTLWDEDDIEPINEYDRKKDVQHFRAKDGKSHVVVESDPKTVFLFFPDQPHQAMLCPHPEDEASCARPVRKVVAKIPWRRLPDK